MLRFARAASKPLGRAFSTTAPALRGVSGFSAFLTANAKALSRGQKNIPAMGKAFGAAWNALSPEKKEWYRIKGKKMPNNLKGIKRTKHGQHSPMSKFFTNLFQSRYWPEGTPVTQMMKDAGKLFREQHNKV